MGERDGRTGDPVMDFDRAFNFAAIWNVDEEPVFHGGFVEGYKFRGAKAGFLFHEMLFNKIRMRE